MALDAQQAVAVIVGVEVLAVRIGSADQPADRVALEFGVSLRALTIFAITDLIQPDEMPGDVITEATGQVIYPHLFAQTIRRVVGEAIAGVVFVDQGRQANSFVVLIAHPFPIGVLACAGQAAGGALKAGSLAFAVGVGKDLAQCVVGEGFLAAIRVCDAQYLAIGLALEAGDVLQGIDDFDQMLALVVAVPGALARTVLKTLDLSACVPPQVLGLVRRIDDGMRKAILAVEIFGLVGEGIFFSDSIALVVIVGFPDAAVRILTLF